MIERGKFISPREIAQQGLLGVTIIGAGVFGIRESYTFHGEATAELDRLRDNSPVQELTGLITSASEAARLITLVPEDNSDPENPIPEQLPRTAETRKVLEDLAAELVAANQPQLAQNARAIRGRIPDVELSDQDFYPQQKGLRQLTKDVREARDNAITEFNEDPHVIRERNNQKASKQNTGSFGFLAAIGIGIVGINGNRYRKLRNKNIQSIKTRSVEPQYDL